MLKRAIIFLVISLIAGAVLFALIRPYLHEKIDFDNFNKDTTPPEVTEPELTPYPGWNERVRQRALAVVIDNTDQARPQSGLEQAEVVIEMPVEGGQTRLLAIISGEGQEQLGPIRSARSYFVDLALEYKAIIVHAGGSTDALEMLEEKKVSNLDEIYGGSQVAAAFWRVTERPKPHNLYSSSDSLRRIAKSATKYDLATPPPQREVVGEGDEISGEAVSDITIFYPNRTSLVRYMFNKQAHLFERFMEEKPHMTVGGQQLTAANVIIQFVPFQYIDGDGHLRLIMHGSGKAMIFRDGKVINGLWKKTPGGFTKYTDAKGNVIPLVQGPTWIQVVPNGTRIEY